MKTNKPQKTTTKPTAAFRPRQNRHAEKRYFSAVRDLRAVGRDKLSRPDQVSVAYLQNEITSYGFNFFPNHYVLDKIGDLEAIAKRYNTQKGE